jgi:hypothetical protein
MESNTDQIEKNWNNEYYGGSVMGSIKNQIEQRDALSGISAGKVTIDI